MIVHSIRPAAVAGAFYPADKAVLRRAIDALLAATPVRDEWSPKALIVPHAGYVYSGAIAASAYALLRPLAAVIRRVVLLGPVHREWTPGLALPAAQAFATPLGEVLLDQQAIRSLSDLPQVRSQATAHAQEHSLEVQLPFLQTVLDTFRLVPLAVGGATPEQVAEVLERLWGGPETLIVVSSDLSHFHAYREAQRLDQSTVRAIEELHINLVPEQACGAYPVNGLLLAAQRHGLVPHLLDLRNSGDTAGDQARVVGYAAFAFTEAVHA